jgi:TPR repeat protein
MRHDAALRRAGMDRQVLISYARHDIIKVTGLVRALRAERMHVWWDRELEPGHAWRRILLDKLHTVDAMIVCWSSHAAKSQYVHAEALLGLERALLVPIRIEPCQPPEPFSEIQTLNLIDWRFDRENVVFRSLLSAIHRNFEEIDAEERFQASLREITDLFRHLDLSAIKRDAHLGKAAAQNLLGHAFLVGVADLTKSLPDAQVWLERAAEQGVVDAMATLGTIHSLLIKPVDWPRALYWFERAAAHGHAASAHEASQIYGRGFEGVPKNIFLAQNYHLLAASLAEARRDAENERH